MQTDAAGSDGCSRLSQQEPGPVTPSPTIRLSTEPNPPRIHSRAFSGIIEPATGTGSTSTIRHPQGLPVGFCTAARPGCHHCKRRFFTCCVSNVLFTSAAAAGSCPVRVGENDRWHGWRYRAARGSSPSSAGSYWGRVAQAGDRVSAPTRAPAGMLLLGTF